MTIGFNKENDMNKQAFLEEMYTAFNDELEKVGGLGSSIKNYSHHQLKRHYQGRMNY